MTTKTWKSAGLMMALIGAAVVAQGQDQEQGRGGRKGGRSGERPSREEMMKKYDKDGDGKLSETEREAMQEEMMDRQRGEGKRPLPEEMMKKYDKDGDGKISEEERAALKKDMDAKREEMKKKYDADGDGELNEAERAKMREEMGALMRNSRRGPEGKNGKGGPEGKNGRKGGERPSREEMIKKYDADGDGKLSDEERAALRKDMQNRQKKEQE